MKWFRASSPIAFCLAFTTVFAQTVTSDNGNIVWHPKSSDGKRTLTAQGLDRQPDLSLDGRLVVFVRDTPNLKVDSPTGDQVQATELWMVGVDGTRERRLLRGGSVKNPNGVPLASFDSPQFAPDGTHVYFLTQAAVVSAAIYSLDLKTEKVAEVCAGNSLQVIRVGEYTGNLIVEQHRYFLGGGSYDWVYVVAPDGKTLGTLGERGDDSFSVRLRSVLGAGAE